MKSKHLEHGTLKGVTVAVLAPKGKSGKSLIDDMTKEGFRVHTADDLDKLLKVVARDPAQALLIDTSFCDSLHAKQEENIPELENLGTEIIVLAETDKTEEAAGWARQFQGYFVAVPISGEEIFVWLERVLDNRLMKNRLARYETPEPSVERFGTIVVKSPEMKDVIRLARILATRDDCVLLVGGVGTGKELLAKTVHESSTRRHGPFYSINCRSFSSEDLAVEIFERGEPGSPESSDGKNLLELSEGGSLLLDEIGGISPNVQGKLQRFLEDGSYTRVNSRTVCKVDVRIFTATAVPLDEAVAKGEFSEDLYFRLNRFTLHIPALRRRGEDILILTKGILNRMAQDQGNDSVKISEEALKMLMEYHWPGNVRELENVMEYACLVAGKGPILPKHLPKQFHDEVGSIFVGTSVDELPPISEIERRYILRVMEATRGNKVKAAAILDINRATLHRKLQMYEKSKVAELG